MGHQVSKVFKQDSVAKSLILCVLTLGCYLIFKLFYFSKTINQLILGAEIYVLEHGKFNFIASFEAGLFRKLLVYTLKAKFEWIF